MTHELLRFAPIAGLALVAGGLIGVFVADRHSRLYPWLPDSGARPGATAN